MFNRTLVAISDKRSTSYSTTNNIDQTDKRIDISKTSQESFFIHCKVGSEQFNILTSPDPYLIDKFHYEYGSPFEESPGCWEHHVYKCYDFGVTVLQIKINNEEAYFELIRREEFENIKVDEGYKSCYSTGIPY